MSPTDATYFYMTDHHCTDRTATGVTEVLPATASTSSTWAWADTARRTTARRRRA